MLVRDIMTRQLYTLKADKKLFIADQIMAWAHTRHVPVVDADNRPVGIISQRDVLRAAISDKITRVAIAKAESRQHLGQIVVEEVMQRDITTIDPAASVTDAARLMMDKKNWGVTCGGE